jgi:SPX domain protein involved in polyphosphate accumulation
LIGNIDATRQQDQLSALPLDMQVASMQYAALKQIAKSASVGPEASKLSATITAALKVDLGRASAYASVHEAVLERAVASLEDATGRSALERRFFTYELASALCRTAMHLQTFVRWNFEAFAKFIKKRLKAPIPLAGVPPPTTSAGERRRVEYTHETSHA